MCVMRSPFNPTVLRQAVGHRPLRLRPRHVMQEDDVNVAETLGLAEENGAEERIVLLQMPALLPSPAPPPAVDVAAAKLRHLRREDAPPAPVALSLKDLPSGKVNFNCHSKIPLVGMFLRVIYDCQGAQLHWTSVPVYDKNVFSADWEDAGV